MHKITLNFYINQRLTVASLAIVDVPRMDSVEKGKWWCSSEYIGQYLAGWFTLHSLSTTSTYTVPKQTTREGPHRTPRVIPAHRVEIGGYALFYDASPNSAFMILNDFHVRLGCQGLGEFLINPKKASNRFVWMVTG